MGGADVLCFQEISRDDPDIASGDDQVAQLGGLFPQHAVVFGPALQRQEREYGNLILSRLPVLQVFNHLLPHPAEGGTRHMQRQAIEAVIQTGLGPLRVVCTHLEYWSEKHRLAQVARLRELHHEVAANESAPALDAASPYDRVPRPSALVLCGDFNSLPDGPEYNALFAPPLVDAWRACRPDERHPATFGVYDHTYARAPECRDYFAVTPGIAGRIASLEVDSKTDASDHQPLRLVLSTP